MKRINQLLTSRSYVPYSGHPDFCVVASDSGTLYPGIRIENISFPLTIDAVQSALYSCLSEGDDPEILYYTKTDSNASATFWIDRYDLELKPIDDLGEYNTKDVLIDLNINPKTILTDLFERALVPHSGFPVAALIETEKGFISGVNIEQDSWEMGLCAERVAISKALAYGFNRLEAIHVQTRSGEYSSPCGACRQVIMEHMVRKPVVIYHPDQTKSMHFSSDLLPYSFTSRSLKKKI